MAVVAFRENTFKVDLTNFEKRPCFEDLHNFIFQSIGLRTQQVKRLQMNHVQCCVHVKCVDLQTAQNVVEQHNNRHELEVDCKRYKVRLMMDDERIEVKIHDLSENVSDTEISTYLEQYGDVHAVKEAVWGKHFGGKGISSGVRVAKMTLRSHLKSFVTIKGEQTLITYPKQPQTCRHCTNLLHTGRTCAENKKILKLSANDKAATNSNTTVVNASTSVGGALATTSTATIDPNINNEYNQHHPELQQQQNPKRPIDRSDSSDTTTKEKSPPPKRFDNKQSEFTTDDDNDSNDNEEEEVEPSDPDEWMIWIQKKYSRYDVKSKKLYEKFGR